MNDEAGDRLRDYIDRRMAEQRIPSVSELARRSHVSRDTFQAWWRGRPPQRGTAELVARELGVTYADLIQAREGAPARPGIVTDPGLARLYELLEAQTAAFNKLAVAIEKMVDRPLVVPGEVVRAMRRLASEFEEPDTSSSPQPPGPQTAEGTPRKGSPGTSPTARGRLRSTDP